MKAEFARDLQKKIIDDLKKIYSPKFLHHWQHPKNWGIMNDADGYAKITGPCGDTMEISIKIKGKKIETCTFDTDGCGSSIACGSILTEMVKNMKIAEAQTLIQEDLIKYCKGLPDEDKHCALLAVNTFKKALENYITSTRKK